MFSTHSLTTASPLYHRNHTLSYSLHITNMSHDPSHTSAVDSQMLLAATALVAAHAEIGSNSLIGE